MIKSNAAGSKFLRAWVLAAPAALLLAAPAPARTPDFLEPQQAFRLSIEPQGGGRLALQWDIAPGYYLYRDRTKVTAVPAGVPLEVALPPGQPKQDPNFGRVQVWHDRARLEVRAPGATGLDLVWQGCAEGGLCYPPQHRTVTLAPAPASTGPASSLAAILDPQRDPPALPAWAAPAPAAAPADAPPVPVAGRERDAAAGLASGPLPWTVALFVLLGIGLAFTPCVLPMVPIVSGIVVGSQARPRRAFALSLAFVLALAVVYALLGTGAALAGRNLQAVLQHPLAIGATAVLLGALALSMFGWYELQLPAFLRDRLAAASPRGGSVAGAALLGAISALLVSPCMTAPLAGTLLYIAQTGEVARGSALLFALGIGMGLPLLAASTVGARVLPRPGPWMNRVKAAFGFALLATAVAMVQRVVPASAAVLLWGAWFALVATSLWSLRMDGGARVLARSAALLAALWSGAMVVGASAGADDPWRPLGPLAGAPGAATAPAQDAPLETVTDAGQLRRRLDEARASGRPALVDFSADWCTSCKTLDREVFADPAVRRALAGAVRLRADVTASDPARQALMREYGVMGPPTVVLFDAQGRELRQDRLVGEFTAADLLARLQRAGAPS